MKEFIELAKGIGLTKEEGEEMLIDSELFIRLFSLFEKMSKRGARRDN